MGGGAHNENKAKVQKSFFSFCIQYKWMEFFQSLCIAFFIVCLE